MGARWDGEWGCRHATPRLPTATPQRSTSITSRGLLKATLILNALSVILSPPRVILSAATNLPVDTLPTLTLIHQLLDYRRQLITL